MECKFRAEFPTGVNHSQQKLRIIPLIRYYTKWLIVLTLILLVSFFSSGKNVYAQETLSGNHHYIELFADQLFEDADYLAYRMMLYEITDTDGNTTDITSRYSTEAIIPGPTIIMDEGDIAEITLFNRVPNPDEVRLQENVSLHVHGVHYEFMSDGTLEYINLSNDQGATLVQSYTYLWDAAPGTAGTWPYHDHNMNSHNGAEDKGLFGALIINPASNTTTINQGGNSISVPLSNITKDYVLYILDDIFIGTEINSETGEQTSVWINPTLSAQNGNNVRFHLISLGTNLHEFRLPGYAWVEPGTNMIVDRKAIGPLEKYVFTVQAGSNAQYMDTTFSGRSQGMVGNFIVNP